MRSKGDDASPLNHCSRCLTETSVPESAIPPLKGTGRRSAAGVGSCSHRAESTLAGSTGLMQLHRRLPELEVELARWQRVDEERRLKRRLARRIGVLIRESQQPAGRCSLPTESS
jgi:hypothetical protein